mgnify:CR=1 FL=1
MQVLIGGGGVGKRQKSTFMHCSLKLRSINAVTSIAFGWQLDLLDAGHWGCLAFSQSCSRGVWEKTQKSDMEPARRFVKHKWVMDVKQSGRFRARLAACRHSQTPGADFTEVCSSLSDQLHQLLDRDGNESPDEFG